MREIFAFLLLASLAYSVSIPNGECLDFALFNESGNFSYNETICAEVPNLNLNITLNASDAKTSSYYDEKYNISIYAITGFSSAKESFSLDLGINQTLWANSTYYNDTYNVSFTCLANATIINNTVYENQTVYVNQTVERCPSLNMTYWANSTQQFIGNGTISCLGNLTVVNTNCNVSATIAPNATDQIIGNVLVRAISPFYCYQNRTSDLGYLDLFRDDACNITVKSPANYTCPACPACPYVNTPTTCPAVPECPICTQPEPQDCRLQVEANTTLMQDSCNSQMQALNSQINAVSIDRDNSKALKDSKEREVGAWKETATLAQNSLDSERILIGLIALIFLMVGVGRKIYDIRAQNRIVHDVSRPLALTKSEKANIAQAGSTLNAYERKKQMGV